MSIGGGLGVLSGKVWRIGLVGINSTERNVITVLQALERALSGESYPTRLGSGVSAAIQELAKA